MPNYIVLKKTGTVGTVDDWTPVSKILNVETAEDAVKQAFGGEGRYLALEWPEEGSEFDQTTGTPTVEPAEPEPEPEEDAPE